MSDVDGLRRKLLTALEVAGPMTPYMERLLIGELLPVVTAWADQQVAEALGEALGIGSARGPLEAVAWMARRHAAALADDGQPT